MDIVDGNQDIAAFVNNNVGAGNSKILIRLSNEIGKKRLLP